IGLISHIILFFLVMRSKDRKPILSFAIAFYLLGLTLISNIIFPIGTHMGERFIFMSSLGFCLALGWLWHNGIKQHSLKTGILILVLGALSFLTVKRSAVWKDDHALFTSDVMTSYNSAKALNAAGGVIIDRCMDSKESCPDTEIQKAVDYLERATMIHPNYKNAHLIKGNGFFLLNDYKAASQSYRRALDIDPSFRQAKENLVITYNNWAQQLGEQENDVDGAIRVLNRALELDPDNLESLRLAGVAYGVKGDLDRAISFFNRILEIEPDNIGAHRNLGVTHMRLGNEELGKTYLRKAENLKKDTE
ncbi:MAG: tetratricopeptide repeat protein, partial [Saprospiraceae bacterium]|nr:tetratricopeptide repeat protein [Saprospiraceae bacterium]